MAGELTVWEPKLISKRCVKCGIHPEPSQMTMMWGEDWQNYTMCKTCREVKEVLVIIVKKLDGIPVEDLKAWYMPVALREFARQTYNKASWQTKVYISDGERFWSWPGWPYNMANVIKWDEFVVANPKWKIIQPEEKTYPEIADYVSC